MLLFGTGKLPCSCLPLFMGRHFEVGISGLQLKMTSLCFQPSWLTWDEWPLRSASTRWVRCARVGPGPHSNIANCVWDTEGIPGQVVFFFIVMKTRSSFPQHTSSNYLQPLKNLWVWKYFFYYHIGYEYSKIASLYFFKDAVSSISFSYENLNFYRNCMVFSVFKVPMDMGCETDNSIMNLWK